MDTLLKDDGDPRVMVARGQAEQAIEQRNQFSTLSLKNVRCFNDVDIPLDQRLTVIIGENGTGKTTIAEAMASLSFGDEEGLRDFPLRRGQRTGHIALSASERSTPLAIWRHGGRYPKRQRLPENRYLLAYGRYRRVHNPETWEPADPSASVAPDAVSLLDELAAAVFEHRTTTLHRPDGRLLHDLSRYLVAIHHGRSFDPLMESIWERLQASLQSLHQGLERIDMVRGETAYIPMVVRRGMRLGINELSDGYQAILVIIFDLILRYAYLFNTLDNPLAGNATVLIDEVDLHLHVRWQRTVLRQLTTLFPGTQFIVTTHSPAVVQGALDDRHPIIVLREQRGAVQAVPLSVRSRKRLQGASIGSLFVEKLLFGADSRYSVHVQSDEEEVHRLRRKVESGHADAADRKRLMQLVNRLESLTATDAERHGEGLLMAEMGKLQHAFLQELAAELEQR